jgi:hypothetical protein
MGAKMAKVFEDPPFELSDGMKDLIKEAQSVFDARYSKELSENPHAKHASVFSPEAGIYIKETKRAPMVLAISGLNNRASDIALKAAHAYMFEIIGDRAQFISCHKTVGRVNDAFQYGYAYAYCHAQFKYANQLHQ